MRPEVAGKQYGILGTSKGAELALLAATVDSRAAAVAAVVRTDVVWFGLPDYSAGPGVETSSWTLGGKPVAYIPSDRIAMGGHAIVPAGETPVESFSAELRTCCSAERTPAISRHPPIAGRGFSNSCARGTAAVAQGPRRTASADTRVPSDIQELRRLRSPAPAPQSLAFDGSLLWMGSRDTRGLYAIDPERWTVVDEALAPGVPWGLTAAGDEFRLLCGEDPGDTRRIRHFSPGSGFGSDAVDAPEDTGSYLGYGAGKLYLVQWYRKRILRLDDAGKPEAAIDVPHGICGLTVIGGRFFCVTTDAEETGDYWLTRVDVRGGRVTSDDVARIPFHARSLAFDGTNFWTNHRDNDEIVCFTPPAGAFSG
ncbi:MAG: hypothetical protein ABR591_03470 [Candidatus Velthaea sp.]